MTLTDADRRLLAAWTADCAAHVLPLFEAGAPTDPRPRQAIDGARAYAGGAKRSAHLRTLVSAAYAAARDVDDPAAAAAARSAGVAAGTAYMHDDVTVDQVKHALGPAMYAALAREAAAAGDPTAADAEIRWAIDHAAPAVRDLIRRLPERVPGRTRQDAIYHQIDVGMRGCEVNDKMRG